MLSMWPWFWIGIVVLVGGFIILGVIDDRIKHRRRYHRPIVCMCLVNNRIGIVLRSDYDFASKRHWWAYYDAEDVYDIDSIHPHMGHQLEVSPTFVFESFCPEYYDLVDECYVERAEFRVPVVGSALLNPLDAAYEHFHGMPRSEGDKTRTIPRRIPGRGSH